MAEKQENVPSNVFGGKDVTEQLKLTGKRISEARKALGISIREMAILHNITDAEYKCSDHRRITPVEFLYSDP